MKIKRILLSLALVLGLTSFGSVANAACGKLTIANMNWASANFMAEVDKIILEEGYGCSVELVPGSTMPTFTSMQEKGEPDIAPEFWANAAKVELEAAVAEGKLHSINKAPITGLGEGWWVLPATLEKHPELSMQPRGLNSPMSILLDSKMESYRTSAVPPTTTKSKKNDVCCLSVSPAPKNIFKSAAVSIGFDEEVFGPPLRVDF